MAHKFPDLHISEQIQDLQLKISRLVGRMEGARGLVAEKPELRRGIRAKTVAATCAIEGNSLAVDEVFTILSGKPVKTTKKDLTEVKNANNAYEKADEWSPWSADDLKNAHHVMMSGLIADAGNFRKAQAGIFHGTTLVHMAPPAKHVSGLIEDMLQSLKQSSWSLPIKALMIHYELEFIHPFADGNGRIGRLWQHVTLLQESEIFSLVPSESVMRDQQQRYYQLLRQTDKTGDAHDFVLFGLEALETALNLIIPTSNAWLNPRDRLNYAREKFEKNNFDRKAYLKLFPGVSSATASRDLAKGVEIGSLTKIGEKSQTQYRF